MGSCLSTKKKTLNVVKTDIGGYQKEEDDLHPVKDMQGLVFNMKRTPSMD